MNFAIEIIEIIEGLSYSMVNSNYAVVRDNRVIHYSNCNNLLFIFW